MNDFNDFEEKFDMDTTKDRKSRAVSGWFDSLGIVLSIIFMILKLCNVIAWPWIYVFLPAIISIGLTLILLVIFIIVAIIVIAKHPEDF